MTTQTSLTILKRALIILALGTTPALGLQLNWAQVVADPGVARAAASDGAGSTYVIGNFSGTVDFDPGTNVTELVADNGDGYIAKYDPNGALTWAIDLGGATNSYTELSDIATDTAGDLWVLGKFTGDIDVNPDPLLTHTLAATNDTEILLAK